MAGSAPPLCWWSSAVCSGYFARVINVSSARYHRVSPWTILRHIVLVLFMLIILLPLAWVLLLSIKSIPDAYRPGFWPQQFDFSHYTYALNNIPTLPRNMLNSVFVTTATVLVTTVCAVLEYVDSLPCAEGHRAVFYRNC